MDGKAAKIWDVAVIGGGPAGMMAAACAAERGKTVVLLEKNASLGKKLLITGGGRCNVTNNTRDTRAMLAKYRDGGKFLFSAFAQFAVADTLQFFNSRGMQTKEENEGRVFPVSNKAQSVHDVLTERLRQTKVEVITKAPVATVERNAETGIFTIRCPGRAAFLSKACIVAAGGTSRPETGSTGDGFKWLRAFGHTVKENDFALVPVRIKEAWAKRHGGISLPEAKLTVYLDGVKQRQAAGKLLFAHFGITGPLVLNQSRLIGELLRYGTVTLSLDLFPKKDRAALQKEVAALLRSEQNKLIKNALPLLVPRALVPDLLALAGIDVDTPCHSLTREARNGLITLLKAVPLTVSGLLGAEKAVVSSGGVAPEEIDFRHMESRLVPNLFIIGDMIDIDRPSGGYSLQLCWTTGFVAGNSW